MRTTIIGNGTAFQFDRPNTSFLVDCGGRKALIDCGFSVPKRLEEMGLLNEFTDVFVTHKHFDHVGGLEPLLYYREFVSKSDVLVHDLPLFDDRLLAEIIHMKVVTDGTIFVKPTHVEFKQVPYGYFYDPNLIPPAIWVGDCQCVIYMHSWHVCCSSGLFVFFNDRTAHVFTGDTTVSQNIVRLCGQLLDGGYEVVCFHDFSPVESPVHASWELFDFFADLQKDPKFALIPVHWGGDKIEGWVVDSLEAAKCLEKEIRRSL